MWSFKNWKVNKWRPVGRGKWSARYMFFRIPVCSRTTVQWVTDVFAEGKEAGAWRWTSTLMPRDTPLPPLCSFVSCYEVKFNLYLFVFLKVIPNIRLLPMLQCHSCFRQSWTTNWSSDKELFLRVSWTWPCHCYIRDILQPRLLFVKSVNSSRKHIKHYCICSLEPR
jgi:hypothetical protein